MWQLAQHSNVYLGLSAAAALLGDRSPYPVLREKVYEVWKEVGSGKLLWGTDAPVTLNHSTYAEMLRQVQAGMEFLKPRDVAQIMGQNALQLYWGEQK